MPSDKALKRIIPNCSSSVSEMCHVSIKTGKIRWNPTSFVAIRQGSKMPLNIAKTLENIGGNVVGLAGLEPATKPL